jgi:hypothetical protein
VDDDPEVQAKLKELRLAQLDAEIRKIDESLDAVIRWIVNEVKHLGAILILTTVIPRDVEQIIRLCPYCGGNDMRWDEERGVGVRGKGFEPSDH